MTITDVPASVAAAADASLQWHPGGPYSLRQTLGTLMRGNGDPSFSSRPDGLWMAFTTAGTPEMLSMWRMCVYSCVMSSRSQSS